MDDQDQRRPAGAVVRTLMAFSAGVVAGAVAIPAFHLFIYGDVDPFQHGFPLCLQISSFVLAVAMTCCFRAAIAASLGLYAGLLGCMLAFNGSEYPISSAIALAVHGLIPATAGALLALCVRHLVLAKAFPVTTSGIPAKSSRDSAQI